MAKPNYQFEKRQRDLAKKKKQEEKRRQKLAGKTATSGDGSSDTTDSPATAPSGQDGAAGVPDSGIAPKP